MKKIIKYSCLILLAISISACGGSKLSRAKKKFTGNWTFLGVKFSDGSSDDRNEVSLVYDDMNLKKDGTCEINSFYNAYPPYTPRDTAYPTKNGTWKVEERPFHGSKAIYIVINYDYKGEPKEEAHAMVGITKNELQWISGSEKLEYREYFRKQE